MMLGAFKFPGKMHIFLISKNLKSAKRLCTCVQQACSACKHGFAKNLSLLPEKTSICTQDSNSLVVSPLPETFPEWGKLNSIYI